MLGVNMPSGRGASPGGGGVITPVAVASGPAHDLGLNTYDLGLSPALASHVVTLKSVNGGSDINATYLSGPDGVVTKPGEPALPLAAVNVTPTDASLVLRGVGLRGGTYVDTAPVFPFSGAPTTELRGVHVPFLSPVFYPGRLSSLNYFGALAGAGGTELLVTPAQHRAVNIADGTSTQRKFSAVNLRLYYSGNLTQAALSEAPTIVDVDALPDVGGVVFTAQVIGDPAAAIYQVWITYSGDGTGAWNSLDLAQCVAPLPAACASEDSRFWKGRLASPPANLKYLAQAVNGVGLVSLDDNRGAYYGVDALAPAATASTFVTPPTTAVIGDSVNFTTKLTIGGVPLAGKTVTVAVGGVSQLSTTAADGTVTVALPVASTPGTYQVTASFAGDDTYQASSTSASFVVGKAASSLVRLLPLGAVLTGTLSGKTEAIQQEAVSFAVTGPNGAVTISSITDYLGQATLPPPGLPTGDYSVTQASYGGNATYASSTVAFSPSQQFTVAKTAQTIFFDPLPDVAYGGPAIALYGTASSGLPVAYAANGSCALAGNFVLIGGLGTCMVTASQAGDANYAAATSVVRTFNINSANQAITFGPAPSGVTVGQPLVFVTATSSSPSSAPTGNPIALTSLTPLVCSVSGVNFARVSLLATGSCTIAANQNGDANYNSAPQATLTFAVGPAGPGPQTFTVSNLNNSGAGSLRSAIAAANLAAPGPNIVDLTGVTGTIVLTSGQIQISRSVSIIGPGSASLTISGNGNSRIFSIFVTSLACPAYEAGPDFLVSISGLTLTNGANNAQDSFAGALYAGHSLALNDVVIQNSIARAGGGLGFDIQFSGQSLTITNSKFINNTAFPAVTPSQFTNSSGGGLNASQRCGLNTPITSPVTVTISNSVFDGNISRPVTFNGRGGAISSFSFADILISDSRIINNHVDAPNPPVAAYQGGGIYVNAANSFRIERSEVAGNAVNDVTASDTTRAGGMRFTNADPTLQGPSNAIPVKIINSTISGNAVAATAGAVQAYGNIALEIDNSTINANLAAPGRIGGINLTSGATSPVSFSNATAPTLKLVSSIVANSTSSSGSTADISTNTALWSTFPISASNSLIQALCSTCNIVVAGPPGNFIGLDPMVSSLAFNPVAAPSRTHALLPGSPAINTGNNPLGLTTDQRGPGFPRVNGGSPDIGAYEF